jgi:hypothetical protein
MKKVELEVYSETPNSGVIRMPGRKFPGVVLQGDTLSILFGNVLDILDRARESCDADLALDALTVARELKAHLVNYEVALAAIGLDLPYSRSVANVQLTQVSDFDEAQPN